MAKRQVEVFTAGCPICQPTVELVREMACADCEVTVHNLHDPATPQATRKAHDYQITTLPAVVVNGQLAACCERGGPNREQLQAAGIGQPLSD